MLKVIVDADACPRGCLAILQKYQDKWGYRLLTVSSVDHQIENPHHITVDKGRDAADFAIVNHTQKGDIVITQDWGLAALVLAKRAFALSPSGRIYSEKNIEFLLEERSLKASFRRSGGRTKGPRARTTEDNARFENRFLLLLKQATK